MSSRAVDQATRKQRAAADPRVSVSLRASAGSGKTRVLVDRFIRLCVEDPARPVEPRSILAVTFTRKAAVEIQERLLARARALALADEPGLRAALGGILGSKPGDIPAAVCATAAALYEKILEDLSGLQIGTIHSFCQTILGRFAAEVGLDPRTTLLENTEDLVDEALDRLEKEMTTGGDEELLGAAGRLGGGPGSVRKAVRDAYGQRLRLERWLRRLRRETGDPEATGSRLDLLDAMVYQLSGALFPDDEPGPGAKQAVHREIADALNELIDHGLGRVEAEVIEAPPKRFKALEKALEKLKGNLLAVADKTITKESLAELRLVLMTTGDTLRKFVRDTKDGWGGTFNDAVREEAAPLLAALRRYEYLEILEDNAALLRLVLRLLDICDELKRRDQVLDFQDLEDHACRLMGDQGRALSLLYRLDDSITHILVDEFQDTNFNQWDMLRPFVEEFLSGEWESGHLRTVFFVGDVKQSIYGFRGAEPGLFAEVEAYLRERDGRSLALPTNFRSLPAVVDAVGCVFSAPPLKECLPAGEEVVQQPARTEGRGTVIVVDPYQDPDPGTDPDGPDGDLQAARAAAALAFQLVNAGVRTWQGHGPDLQERPLTWGDILVLCRTRTAIGVYEKAFRDLEIPMAAAGRGTLATSREIQDVLALLRWLVYPEDDVALATVLRSPLFRLAEPDFQAALARRRLSRTDGEGRFLPPLRLWRSLRKLTDDSVVGPAVALLHRWRAHVGKESAHDLLRRIYREGHVPARYQAALGSQARLNLLRLFDLSLAPEVAGTPTVRRLVEVIERAARLAVEEEADAPPEEGSGRVRFMTIHGAKGLEAPVVILVDADRRLGKEDAQVRLDPGDPDSPFLFGIGKLHRSGYTDARLPETPLEAAARLARDRGRTEDADLLYVAMTRARDRLYVLGGRKSTSKEHVSFLSQLGEAADGKPCPGVGRELPGPGSPGISLDIRAAEEQDPGVAGESPAAAGDERLWTPPALVPRIRTVSPSAMDPQEEPFPEPGPAGSGDTSRRREGIRRGNLVHLLLQQAAQMGRMPPGGGPEHAEAAAVFGDPDLDWIFHPETEQGRGLSEVPLIHRRPGSSADGPESRVTGIIDRLVLRPGRLDIIDYKTNRTGGDPALIATLREHYRPQLQAYRQALAELYPDREIHTWLLFTEPVPGAREGGRLEELE